MRRRDLIAGLGATMGLPFAARAQGNIVIGFMSARSPEDSKELVPAFRQGLSDEGFAEGRNLAVEYRWARGDYGRLPALAVELVKRPVSVLVAVGGDAAARAAVAATLTIPIVFGMGSDPVAAGIVRSLNHPGGNVTGVNILTIDIEAKRLGLLNQLVPQGLIGALVNPAYPPAPQQVQEIRKAAERLGRSLVVLNASTDAEIDAAFAALVDKSARALLVGVDPFFDTRLDRIVALAAQRRLPAIYQFREYVLAGGLMSYGVKMAYAYEHFGIYAGKILKGAKPADLPVLQSVGFECLINQKAAKALGLTIPPLLIAQADEVIE